MSRKTKFTPEVTKRILVLIRDGYTMSDACRGARISTDTFYRWCDKYPDFHKAVVEATDLQWKYAEQLVRSGYRGYIRRLNRPSVNYQSPENMGFKVKIPVWPLLLLTRLGICATMEV